MKKATIDLLRELTEANGVPGYEGRIAAIMRTHLLDVADEICSDGLGSLIARLDGSAERPRVMLAAHLDEIGFMAKLVGAT